MDGLIERAIAQQERKYSVSMDYLRDVAAASPAAFLKFGAFTPLATHRKAAPLEAWHLVRLGATQAQDCGPCVQVVVNVAVREGVAPDLLRRALAGSLQGLHAEAFAFGRAVSSGEGDAEALRGSLKGALGEAAAVELALAAATAAVFPILKRGLGRANACSLVRIDVPESVGG